MLLQKKILVAVESLCERLPGTPGKLCKEEVEKMLPMALTFITAVIVSPWILHRDVNWRETVPVCLLLGALGSCRNQLRSAKSSGSAAPQTGRR